MEMIQKRVEMLILADDGGDTVGNGNGEGDDDGN